MVKNRMATHEEMELVRYWLTLKVEFKILRNETGQFVALADPTEDDWSGEGSKIFYWSFILNAKVW